MVYAPNIAKLVRLLFSIYLILIIMRVLFTWLRPNMFNPLVRFVCQATDPYLKLFAGIRFLRIGAFDFSILLAFYVFYLIQELVYDLILQGSVTPELVISLVIVLAFRFAYFILVIFLIATGIRFVLELAGRNINNVIVSAVYSLSEPVVAPVRRIFRMRERGRFDMAVFLSLLIVALLRFLVLPQLLKLLLMLIRAGVA
jgi:YggT family protein